MTDQAQKTAETKPENAEAANGEAAKVASASPEKVSDVTAEKSV